MALNMGRRQAPPPPQQPKPPSRSAAQSRRSGGPVPGTEMGVNFSLPFRKKPEGGFGFGNPTLGGYMPGGSARWTPGTGDFNLRAKVPFLGYQNIFGRKGDEWTGEGYRLYSDPVGTLKKLAADVLTGSQVGGKLLRKNMPRYTQPLHRPILQGLRGLLDPKNKQRIAGGIERERQARQQRFNLRGPRRPGFSLLPPRSGPLAPRQSPANSFMDRPGGLRPRR